MLLVQAVTVNVNNQSDMESLQWVVLQWVVLIVKEQHVAR